MASSSENHYPRLCENNLLNSCHGETDTSDRWKMQVVLVQTDDSDGWYASPIARNFFIF